MRARCIRHALVLSRVLRDIGMSRAHVQGAVAWLSPVSSPASLCGMNVTQSTDVVCCLTQTQRQARHCLLCRFLSNSSARGSAWGFTNKEAGKPRKAIAPVNEREHSISKPEVLNSLQPEKNQRRRLLTQYTEEQPKSERCDVRRTCQ